MNTPFALPPELTIYHVAQIRDAVLTWATEQAARPGALLEIRASGVEEVDGAGLQLVAALFNMDLPWRLSEPSEVFSQACLTLGLERWLERNPGGPAAAEAAP